MTKKRLVILGFDGLDPTLVQRYMDQGRLPNLKRLAQAGSFSSLQTSNPPQSPVAWATFISGADPGTHDVFDFIVRDPATYLPEVGMTQEKKNDGTLLRKIMAGLSGPSLVSRRKGQTFWDQLGQKGIKSVILRCPMTFPADPMTGRLLSGMGTPDLRGTQGYSALYSTDPAPAEEIHGKWVHVTWKENGADTLLYGPWIQSGAGRAEATIPLVLKKESNDSLRLSIGGQDIKLKKGTWSDWVPVQFKNGPLQSLKGIVKFHLSSVQPSLKLFVTPINMDPRSPAFPISSPKSYSGELCDHLGFYYTQGMPYDTWALNENRLSEKDFLEQAYSILDENQKTLNLELGRFDEGLLFCYFGITDLVQHMFWRYQDPGHPAAAKSTDPEIRDAIPRIYEKADAIVGEVLAKLPPDTGVIVLSDHGFGSFRRAVHLNSWLRDNGYLTVSGGKEGKEFFTNVDWSQTQAYSVGFGGIYLNQFGRERSGTVYKGAEAEKLKTELIAKLLKWKDVNGAAVIKHVYRREDLYHGPYAEAGPDLLVGFNLPYRASWQTGLGAAPEKLIEDNTRAWSGDHLCDPELVPGVLFSSFKISQATSSLSDLAPKILHYLTQD